MYLPRSLIAHLYTHLVRSHHPLSPPVLILAALEPDALCACRILTALLKRDYIPHKIHPVSGYADLTKAGLDLIQPMKTSQGGSGGVVICLGVGGLVDLAEILDLTDAEGIDPSGGVEVWVLDSRRPWNLSNIFGGSDAILPLSDAHPNAPKKNVGVEKGCIQHSYRPGKGGVIVFDDGDIGDDLAAERDAYFALAEMPDIDEQDDDSEAESEDDQETDLALGNSKKRKSWSDRENEDPDSDSNDERPRRRRRSNSGSSISSSPGHTPPSSQPSSSPKPVTKQPSVRQLRKRLLSLRRSHEAVLEQYFALGTSYSEPISSLAYSLASEVGREDNDLLWWTIVGVTSLDLAGHTSAGLGISQKLPSSQNSRGHYGWKANRSARTLALLRDEVRRLNPPPHDQSPSISPGSGVTSSSDTSIRLSPDPKFLLLRHWSLYDSMLHSPYLASRLHVWNESGVKRLHKLLAKMGVSLSQCKQIYTHMDMDLKKTLREKLLKYAGVYGLDDVVPAGAGYGTMDQGGWGFVRSWGWKAQLSAIDAGVILAAILDVGSHTVASITPIASTNGSSQAHPPSEEVDDRSVALLPRFFAAYDALAPNQPSQLIAAIPLAQHLLRSILRTGSSLLAKHQIRHLRAFRMGVVKEGPDLSLFANSPGALIKLALWLGEAVAISEKDKKGTDTATPLVLAALDEVRGVYVVVGAGGGIGGGPDIEARQEKADAEAKKSAEREQKQKVKAEKKAAKAAEREARKANGDEDDNEEEEESEEESDESEEEDDDDDDGDAELEAKLSKRGYGQNRFGIAFQEVVEETNARVKIDSFDHCVVEVKKEDLGGFLEGLSLKTVVGR